jgi:hypothetical protein
MQPFVRDAWRALRSLFAKAGRISLSATRISVRGNHNHESKSYCLGTEDVCRNLVSVTRDHENAHRARCFGRGRGLGRAVRCCCSRTTTEGRERCGRTPWRRRHGQTYLHVREVSQLIFPEKTSSQRPIPCGRTIPRSSTSPFRLTHDVRCRRPRRGLLLATERRCTATRDGHA